MLLQFDLLNLWSFSNTYEHNLFFFCGLFSIGSILFFFLSDRPSCKYEKSYDYSAIFGSDYSDIFVKWFRFNVKHLKASSFCESPQFVRSILMVCKLGNV